MDSDSLLSALGITFLALLFALGVAMGIVNIGSINAVNAIKQGWFEYDHKVYRVIPAEVKANG